MVAWMMHFHDFNEKWEPHLWSRSSELVVVILLLLILLLLNPRQCLRMLQRSVCARDGKRVSSRPSLLWSASRTGQRRHGWSYVLSSSLQIRHVASSDLLIRFGQWRSAGWCLQREHLSESYRPWTVEYIRGGKCWLGKLRYVAVGVAESSHVPAPEPHLSEVVVKRRWRS